MPQESPESDVYIYLEFDDKLSTSIFENSFFLRIANLHKDNPLVQVNDLIFNGTYYDCMGTNMFFEEIENPSPKTSLFEKGTPIRLKYFLSQSKVLRLKQIKLPQRVPERDPDEQVNVILKRDYKTCLDKLKQGHLWIEDLAVEDEPVSPMAAEVNENEEEIDVENVESEGKADQKLAGESLLNEVKSTLNLLNVDKQSPGALLTEKYERLKRLSRRPVRRIKTPELGCCHQTDYEDIYYYRNLENELLQPNSSTFRSTCQPVLEKSYVGGLDIDRCMLQGLLPQSNNVNRTLSKEELAKVFKADNFANLSLPVRYMILKACLSEMEEFVRQATPDVLRETDKDGRTISDGCEILKRLISALELHLSRGDNVKLPINIEKDSVHVDGNYFKYQFSEADELTLINE